MKAAILFLLFCIACNSVDKKSKSFSDNSVSTPVELASNFLQSKFAQDTTWLEKKDRVFAIDSTDLNGDGKKEFFIYLASSAFCGSGGCTFFLLDPAFEFINQFTVSRAPIFVEPGKKNGWAILLIKSGGQFRELIYSEGKYPENPSLIDPPAYDAPSGHAQVLFDERWEKLKLYPF